MSQSKNNETYKITLEIAKLAFFINLAIAVVMFIVVFRTGVSTNDESGDFRNWVSLVIEVGLAIFVGLAILIYSNNEQKRISNLIQNMNEVTTKLDKIIEHQHTREKQWKNEWGKRTIDDLKSIKELCSILEKWLVDYSNNKSESSRTNIMGSAARLSGLVDFHIQNLHTDISKIENLLNDPVLATIITKQSKYYTGLFKILDKEFVWEDEGLKSQIQAIEGMIKAVEDLIDRMEKEIIVEK